MDFKLKRACSDCPFRKDVNMHLNKNRARQIADDVANNGRTFTCHKTIGADSHKEQHCVGALIFSESNAPNQMLQVAERLGLYRPDEIDRDVSVFKTVDEMAEHYS